MIRFLLIILFVTLTLSSVDAQTGGEVLAGLESMPSFNSESSKKQSISKKTLPFFDDFSHGYSSYAPTLWGNGHVFVNNTYSINSKTNGVATFDAMASDGNFHYNASVYPFSADTLTSVPIDLNFPADTTIYLTFWYQPQGRGNQPQPQDSLLLEFFDSQQSVWVKAWFASANFEQSLLEETNCLLPQRSKSYSSDTLSSTFFMVHFPILDERFLTPDFRFRFRNYASISENQLVPSLRVNCDHWHIDIVWLERNRHYADTVLNDVAFFEPLGSILNTYKSIPWKHFAEAKPFEVSDPLEFLVEYQNMGNITWNVTRRFSIVNASNQDVYNFSGGAENVFPSTQVSYSRFFAYDFTSAWADSAKFNFTSYLITDINDETYHLRWNDTIRYDQVFSNFYACDDGSAENGYGLFGEGTQNGRVAVKFTNYKADSLVGVYMYFNRSYNNANYKYFKLAIWDDNSGKPGNLVYEQVGLRPTYADELNKFVLFELDESFWVEAGTYYVGWIQTTVDFLNFGFDLNTESNGKVFYNISGQWQNSQYNGTLMIRPVFGEIFDVHTSTPDVTTNLTFNLFPNPANTTFKLSIPCSSQPYLVRIFSITGQLVSVVQYNNNPIDISSFQSGTYIVSVADLNRVIGTKKLIIIR